MIKIDLQKKTKPLSKNPIIQEFLFQPTINLQEKYRFSDISFMDISCMIDKLSPGYDDVIICIVSLQSYDDLLTEQAALRMYDSNYHGSEQGCLSFETTRGAVKIIGHSLMDKDGVLFLNPDDSEVLRNTVIKIKTDQLDFTQSTDFSKVNFKITHATKFNNER